jgi:hypothetical protein
MDNNCDGRIDEGCVPPGDSQEPSVSEGCTQRGCGWSLSENGAMFLFLLLPGLGRRVRRNRGSPR